MLSCVHVTFPAHSRHCVTLNNFLLLTGLQMMNLLLPLHRSQDSPALPFRLTFSFRLAESVNLETVDGSWDLLTSHQQSGHILVDHQQNRLTDGAVLSDQPQACAAGLQLRLEDRSGGLKHPAEVVRVQSVRLVMKLVGRSLLLPLKSNHISEEKSSPPRLMIRSSFSGFPAVSFPPATVSARRDNR